MKELCPFPCRASTRDSSPIFIARSLVQQRHALLGVAGPCVTEQTPPCGIATAHRARLSRQAPEGRGRSERACGSALQRQAAALARPGLSSLQAEDPRGSDPNPGTQRRLVE